ncbi:hypothetical protein HY546_03170 [archaeon]|nr:hypothetical protein [archaeon]
MSRRKEFGGAFVTKRTEKQILEKELALLASFRTGIHVVESSVFSLAHCEASGWDDLAEKYWPLFLRSMKKKNTTILFIDCSPETSFKRRERVYRMLAAKAICSGSNQPFGSLMNAYRRRIDAVYPHLKRRLTKLQKQGFKTIVMRNESSLKAFKRKLEELASALSR